MLSSLIAVLLFPFILVALIAIRVVFISIRVMLGYFTGWLFAFLPIVPSLLTDGTPITVEQIPLIFAVLAFVSSFFKETVDYDKLRRKKGASNEDGVEFN